MPGEFSPARARNGAGFFVSLLAGLLIGCASFPDTTDEAQWKRYHYTEPEMGTVFELTYYAPDDATAERAGRAAFDRVEALNAIFSDYEPESELRRLCQQPAGTHVKLSTELFNVLQHSQRVAVESGGAFDVTVGPCIQLWRQARRQRALPAPARLAEARALMGFEKLELNATARTAVLKTPGMRLDLGGIAKGYAADAALAVLRQHGIRRALVAASGDLAVGDPPPGKTGWTIGMMSFTSDKPDRTAVLRNCGVSTSGDTQQFLVIDGVRYSHIIDPRTGQALTQRISVTIIAPDATTSDVLATAVCVLGAEKGIQVLRKFNDIHTRAVSMREGKPVETVSESFPKNSK